MSKFPIDVSQVKLELEKMLSTVEIMRKAKEEGELTEKECDVAITAWNETKTDNSSNSERIKKFNKLLGTSFGPRRSKEIYDTLMKRTSQAKQEATRRTEEIKKIMQQSKNGTVAANGAVNSSNNSSNPPTTSQATPNSAASMPKSSGLQPKPTMQQPIQHSIQQQQQQQQPINQQLQSQPQSQSQSQSQQLSMNSLPRNTSYQMNQQPNQVNLMNLPNNHNNYQSNIPYPAGVHNRPIDNSSLNKPKPGPGSTDLASQQQPYVYQQQQVMKPVVSQQYVQPQLTIPQSYPAPPALNLTYPQQHLNKTTNSGAFVPLTNNNITNNQSINGLKMQIPTASQNNSPFTAASSVGTGGGIDKRKLPSNPDLQQPDPKKAKKLDTFTDLKQPIMNKESLPTNHQSYVATSNPPRSSLPAALPIPNPVPLQIPTSIPKKPSTDSSNDPYQELDAKDSRDLEEIASVVGRYVTEEENNIARKVLRDSISTNSRNHQSVDRDSSTTFSIDSSLVDNEENARLWKDWKYANVIDQEALDQCIAKAINTSEMTVESKAMILISNAVQVHIRMILEMAVVQNRRRLNKVAINNYRKIYTSVENINTGREDIESSNIKESIAMKWGPEVDLVLKHEENHLRAALRERALAEENNLLTEIKSMDQKMTTIKRSSKDGSDEPDWVYDEWHEKRGDLSWGEIARAHTRSDVAQKNEILLKKSVKKQADGMKDRNVSQDSNSNSITTKTIPMNAPPPEITIQSLPPTGNHCPLLKENIRNAADEIQTEDILMAISKRAVSKNGGPMNLNLGSSFRRATYKL